MDDDLNTADAIGVIFDLVKELNTAFSQGGDAAQAKEGLGMLDELLGVLGFIKEEREEEIPSEIQALAEERAEARKAKDWTRADAIRDQLKEAGYELKDTPEGVKITRV